MKQTWQAEGSKLASRPAHGLVRWLLNWRTHKPRPRPRLAVIERIALAPRHSLALIEADGLILLVTVSQDGASAFYALNGVAGSEEASRRTAACNSPVTVSC